MRALPPKVLLMADAARGTVSRSDLGRAGYSASTIDDWLTTGLLQRVQRGEYRVPGSGEHFLQHVATRLWRAGDGARIAGALACGALGLTGFSQDESSFIAIPPQRRVTGVRFPVVRTPLLKEDQAVIRGLPGVTVERALIGAAATHRPARVRAAYYDAKFKGLTTEAKLARRAVALGRAYGAPQMRAILDTGALKVESFPEFDLQSVFRPDERPAAQVWVQWHDKWFRLDFAFLDARLALEYDGGDHDRSRQEDADRDLALLELSIQTIRVTKAMLRDPDELRRRILAVRAQRRALGLAPIVPGKPPWLLAD